MTATASLVTLCLLVGMTLSKVIPRPCEKVKDGLCGRGQYVFYNDIEQPSCLDCPADTFMDVDSHLCGNCKTHAQPSLGQVNARQGDSTSDNIIICSSGFYRQQEKNLEVRGQCVPCSVCKVGTRIVRECGDGGDTFCCVLGMVGVQSEEGLLECVIHSSKQGHNLIKERKVRSPLSPNETTGSDVTSPGTDDQAKTSSDNKSDNKIAHKTSDRPPAIPQHSYSRADEEDRRQMVEFPMWARFLCAGIAVGIFLFYLGVGIPCNACGSLDKLRLLKGMITRSNDRRPAEEESEKPMNPKSGTV